MISKNVDKKSNNVYLMAAGIVILVVFFIILYMFVFKGDNGEDQGLSNNEVGLIEKIQVKKLDLEIFQDQKFIKLKDSESNLPDISEIYPGKTNPFEVD